MDVTIRKPDGTFECYRINMREPEGDRKTINKEASQALTDHVKRVQAADEELMALDGYDGPRLLH